MSFVGLAQPWPQALLLEVPLLGLTPAVCVLKSGKLDARDRSEGKIMCLK